MANSDQIYEAKLQLWEQRAGQGMEATKKFATMKVEALKDRLCTCSPEEVRGLQGEVAAYQELLDAITIEPHKIN